jgi:glycosyltransferase involved in cell wall biosynthesis
MKKMLIVTTIPVTLSGFFGAIARHLRARGWQVDGMAQGASTSAECLEAFDRAWDVELFRNPLDPRNLIAAPQQIQAAFRQEAYDIVHVSTPVAALVTRYALSGFRQQQPFKVIYTAQGFHFYRGGNPAKNAIFLTLEKLAGPWTDYLVVVNREDEGAAMQSLVSPDQVRYIPGTGVNVDRFNPRAVATADIAKVRQELGLQSDTPLFLSIGEFIPRKRPADILKALAQLDRSDVHLAFAGSGPLLQPMQQLAANLGLQERVHFLGLRRDIPQLIRTAIATILASEHEGLPNCVMESLYLEVPVIGSQIRGTTDLLAKGSGLLFESGNIQRLAEAMGWILEHPQEALAMGKQGATQMANYGLPQILKQYEALYGEAIEGCYCETYA